jgi:phage protein D
MTSRALSAAIVVNGTPCPTTDVTVEQTSLQSPDTFHGTLALNKLPPGRDAAFFSSTDEIEIEVTVIVGFSGGLLFSGSADSVDVDWEGGLVKLSGRDKSKKLLESKDTDTFKNKSPEEIVEKYAGEAGLSTEIDSSGVKAGKQYRNEWNRVTDLHSKWSAIQHMADREGKVAFVQKNKLYFKKIDESDMGEVVIDFTPQTSMTPAFSNVIKLHTSRNLELARKTKVRVRSYNSETEETHDEQEEAGGSGEERVYDYRHAGMTKDQAKRTAKKRLREHTRHERGVKVDLPGDPDIAPLMKLIITSTGTAWDQDYHIDRCTHRIKGDQYDLNIIAKNTSKGR